MADSKITTPRLLEFQNCRNLHEAAVRISSVGILHDRRGTCLHLCNNTPNLIERAHSLYRIAVPAKARKIDRGEVGYRSYYRALYWVEEQIVSVNVKQAPRDLEGFQLERAGIITSDNRA